MKYLNPLLHVLLAIIILTALAGCVYNGGEPNQKITVRTIVDMRGRTVAIPVTVNRVAANGMSLTQLILLLGSVDKLVATMVSIKNDPWHRMVFPRLATIPAPFTDGIVNLEELLNAHPDVVFLWSGTESLQIKLTTIGIPVIILTYGSPEELTRAARIMGTVLGHKEEKVAEKFCTYYEGNMKRILARTAQLPPEQRVRVYYASDTPLTTEGAGSIVSAWIEAAGGINVATRAGRHGIGEMISSEELLMLDPEVIIVRDARHSRDILENAQWRHMSAVANRRVHVNPKGVNVWCARSGDGALQFLWAAKILHPDIFRDINIEDEVRFFYETFYHYRLSGREVTRILQGAPPL